MVKRDKNDNLKRGDGFDTHPEWINRNGRPPKLISTLVNELKANGYERATATNVTEAIEHLINLPEDEIKAILNDKNQPLSIRILSKQLLSNKGFEALEVVLSRAQGRPKQQMDVSNSGEQKIKIEVVLTDEDGRSDPIE